MKPIIVASVILLASLASPAFAGCAQTGGQQSRLTQSQLDTILAGKFACGRSTAVNPPGWNERHDGSSGGRIIEQHEAGSADDEDVGSWATSASGNKGRVTYAYTGGVTPAYEVAFPGNVDCGTGTGAIVCTGLPQIYEFCGVGGGAPTVLNILVTNTLPILTACPANP